jgi:hypothetical protein
MKTKTKTRSTSTTTAFKRKHRVTCKKHRVYKLLLSAHLSFKMPGLKETGKEVVKWEESAVKKMMFDDIQNHFIPADMKSQAVRKLHTEYNDMDPLLFSSRLRSLRKNIALQNERIASNKLAHDHNRQLYPVEQFDMAHLPRWNGSPADELVKEDLSLGRYVFGGAPTLLYKSRIKYQAFSLTVFRRHIHQEIQTRKYRKWYSDHFSKK